MKNSKPFLSEFRFTAPAPGSDQAPQWQVEIASLVDDGLGGIARGRKSVTMETAKEEGYTLPKIIEGLNAVTMIELEKSRATIAELERTVAEQTNAVAQLGQQHVQHVEHIKLRETQLHELMTVNNVARTTIAQLQEALHRQGAFAVGQQESIDAMKAELDNIVDTTPYPKPAGTPPRTPRGSTGRRRARPLHAR